MLSPRLLWMAGTGVACLAALWLAGDAIHAIRIRARARHPSRSASTEPITLRPSGSPVVLLIHGFADGPSVFDQLAPPLAEAGLCVRGLRLAGSGIPPDQMAGTTLETWRTDIDREIAALRAAAPSRPVWLLGHSLGGVLAFDAALRPHNQVAGLVLLAPLLEPSSARSPLLTSRQWFHLLDHLLVFTRIVESHLPADLHDPDARAAYRTDQFIHRDIYRALFATIDAIVTHAAEWHGPLWVAVSETDQIVEPSAARRFFSEAIHADPSELVEVANAGHVLPLDYGHRELAAGILAFTRTATLAHPSSLMGAPSLTPPPGPILLSSP